MRYCVIKGTTSTINSSAHNTDEIFMNSALGSGFTENEVEILTEEEFELRVQNEPKPIIPDPDAELATAITNATTLEELKKALLGNNGHIARVKGRMKNT